MKESKSQDKRAIEKYYRAVGAIEDGDISALDRLIHGDSVIAKTVNDTKWTLLHWACREAAKSNKPADIVAHLLDNGFMKHINKKDSEGCSPLYTSIYYTTLSGNHSDLRIAKLLAERGANIEDIKGIYPSYYNDLLLHKKIVDEHTRLNKITDKQKSDDVSRDIGL